MNKKEIILLILTVLSIIGIIYTCIDSKNRVYNTQDIEAPYVEKSEPMSRDRFVSIDSEIQIYFNKHMAKNTITQENILFKNKDGELLEYSLEYDNKIAVIQPAQNLNYDSEYVVEVLTKTKDRSGNRLEMSFKSEFKTVPQYIPLIQTGQKQSYKEFDDGYYKIGYSRNFIKDEFNKIVEDEYTGYQWQDDDNVYSEERTFVESKEYCENLEYAGFSDWRLPKISELFTTINFKTNPQLENAFLNSNQDFKFWSNDNENNPYVISYNLPLLVGKIKDDQKANTRCVRGTNLTDRSFNNDDSIQAEIDSLSGLMWNNTTLVKKKWNNAIQYCEDLTQGGFNDWRLPNINELVSLLESRNSVSNIQNKEYITSTVTKQNGEKVYFKLNNAGEMIDVNTKKLTESSYVKCVRKIIE